ncbi:hypothetical protein [Paucisalibacillus sp. EB02]|uniref:hypothetical protein n=1 Tax=Paucisalibacillus sp. EB02 TaxID=1347087 RepID=UPI0005A643A0|nr:hypothetical protein [Paucisalibacillus sp. EB02]
MIKKYTIADKEKLKKLISIIDEDKDAIYIAEKANCICAFTSYHQTEMIGFLVSWKSSFHPFCTYFDVIHHPNHTTCIGELMEKLEENLKEEDYPLQTGVHENSFLDNYYREKNFDLIRKTYLPTIHLPYQGITSREPTNFEIRTLEDILPGQMEQLVRLVKRIYEETHLVNPVAEFELDRWKGLIFAEDLIRQGSYVLVDKKEEIISYSLLHASESNGTVEFGWKGTRDRSEIETINLLVSSQIEYGKRKGYKKLEGEFDTTDPYALEVLNHFGFPKSPVWITYQKKQRS